MDQMIQIAGALMILFAYALAQRGTLDQHSVAYLFLNLVGSLVLGILAFLGRQWGFFLLEAAWAIISLRGLFGRARAG